MSFDATVLDAVFAESERGLCLIDADDRIVRVNDGWRSIVGVGDDVVGRPLWDFLPDPTDELKRRYREVRQSGKPVVTREASVRPIGPHGAGGLLVTSRPGSHALQSVLDGLLEGCHIIGRDWRYLYVNDAMTRNARKSREELLGRTIMEVSPGIEKTELFRTFERCFAEQTSTRMETEFRFVDGSTAWFDLSIQPQGDSLVVLSIDITERKRTDDAVIATRDKLEGIIQASPIALIALDLAGNVILWSAAAERMFGYTADEVLGKPVPIIPEAEKDRFAESVRRAQEGEHLKNIVTTRRARDGRLVPVNVSTWPIGTANGKSQGNVAALIDLSSEVALREALDASERRLSAAFDASPVAKLLVRVRDRSVVETNRAYLELSGERRDTVIGADVTTLALTPFSDAPTRTWARIVEQPHPRDIGFPFRTHDGRRGEAVASLERLRLHDEDYALVVLQDVTAREVAKRELEESNARFRQLADSIEEVFWLTDLDQGKTIYVSPAYEVVFGRSRAALQTNPRDWVSALHPDDRERILGAAPRQASGDFDEEYRVVRPDGSVRWIRARAFPVKDSTGRTFRVAGTAQDVTVRRELEQQLRQTQKMESIGLLAGGIAHDFNNILTVIASSCQELEEELPPGADTAGIVGEIAQASERAASLTRQLLSFSRREVISPRVVDFGALVSETEKMLRRILGEDVILSLSPDRSGARVLVDPGSWDQVLMNLAVNARDAMPRGGALVIETRTVALDEALRRAHPSMKPGSYVMLSVADTGCGMSRDVQAHVFEPFFTTKGVGQGSGLGLSVVHGIVAQSGGLITVTSEPDVGTTFRIYLPLYEGEVGSDQPRRASRHSRPGSETILVVEDEESIRRIVVRVLEKAGYEVLTAKDGETALALSGAHSAPIHLLVTDVVMPHMDGRALAEALRATRPKMGVLYTSGYTNDAVMRYGIRHAEVAFLSKPYGPSALLEKVRDVLDGG